MKYCPNCGQEVKEGAKFCPKCGSDLSQVTLKQETTTDQTESQKTEFKASEPVELILEQAEGLNMTRAEMKNEAQRKLSGRYGEWFKSILWAIVGIIISSLLVIVASGQMSAGFVKIALYRLYGGTDSQFGTGLLIFFWLIILIAAIIALFLIGCLLNAVMQWCAIFTLKGQRADGLKIFNYFVKVQKNRVLKANILISLYQFFWSLLFIIPGIVKQASYAMTNLILEKNPELSASEAINQSRKMMHGYKLEFLILQYSFFFWRIVAGVTYGLADFYVLPYQNVTQMAFLEVLYQKYQD